MASQDSPGSRGPWLPTAKSPSPRDTPGARRQCFASNRNGQQEKEREVEGIHEMESDDRKSQDRRTDCGCATTKEEVIFWRIACQEGLALIGPPGRIFEFCRIPTTGRGGMEYTGQSLDHEVGRFSNYCLQKARIECYSSCVRPLLILKLISAGMVI